jgi:L-fuculose-phosphate aldolase
MDTTNGRSLAEELVKICHLMYQKDFIASSEGNVSVRLDLSRILVTPRGVHKGFLRPEHLVVTDLDGHQLSGDLLPSSELQIHLLVYRERLDVTAVIHAHPTMAIACSLTGMSLADGVLPEVIVGLGAIPTAPYSTPGTKEAAEAIRSLIRQFDAIILARHGSVTVGKNLLDAYSKLEMLEHSARILSLARLLGPVSPLPAEEVARLLIAGGHAPSTLQNSVQEEEWMLTQKFL